MVEQLFTGRENIEGREETEIEDER